MATVTVSPLFESVSGKLCHRSSTYIAVNSKTGRMYSAERHASAPDPTEAQTAHRTEFASLMHSASAAWASAKAANTDAYQQIMADYKAQDKIGNPYSYFLKRYIADPTILGESSSTTTSSSSSTTPSAGLEE